MHVFERRKGGGGGNKIHCWMLCAKKDHLNFQKNVDLVRNFITFSKKMYTHGHTQARAHS